MDPSDVGLQNELEKVQYRAARFVTGNYNFESGSMTGILEYLKWASHKKNGGKTVDSYCYTKVLRITPVYQMTLSPWLGAAGMIILWHIRSPLLTLIFISDHYGLESLPDSLISSAEGAEDGVSKFTSLVRARD